ncbi:MAG: response regulator [Polyangiaceae bacterium]|nr:response regulator [Polyangiaceae bacterium]
MDDERERVLLEMLNTAALTTDAQGRIRYANRTAEAMLGKAALELVGAELLSALSADPHAELQITNLRQGAVSGQPIFLSSESGIRLPFRVVDLAGDRYVLLGPSVTTSAENPRHPVDNVVASLLHELSNPLTFTLVNLDVALKKLEELPPEDLEEPLSDLAGYVKNAHEGASRMRSIARKMSTDTARENPWPRAAELTQVLDHALLLAWNEVRHAVHVIKRYGASPEVVGDQHVLTRALAELLAVAAADYRQAGATTLALSVKRHATTASVEIVNEGGSTSAHAWGSVDESRLQFAREAIVSTGGHFRILQRAEGTERCFELDLPLAPSNEAGRASSTSAVRSRSARVLFIDDEALLAETLQLAFRGDHDVQAVTSAKAALALLERDRDFDLILCDLMMPEETGQAVFTGLKRLAPELLSRFVLMTGGAFTPTTVKFLEDFPGLTLEKPFQVQDIEALIVQFLELRQRR